jgi:hypothetical protein
MVGGIITIPDASAPDTILSIKERVFALNRTLFVRRQRLVYTADARGMEPLADDETLGGAGVAQDGSAKLDVLVADLTAAEVKNLGEEVLYRSYRTRSFREFFYVKHLKFNFNR